MTTVWNAITDFFSEVSGLTHFINRVWTAMASFFEFLGTLLNPAVGAIRSVFTFFDTIHDGISFTVTLIPPFAIAWIGLFISVAVAGLAISIILELL